MSRITERPCSTSRPEVSIYKSTIGNANPTVKFADSSDWLISVHYCLSDSILLYTESRRIHGTYDFACQMLRSLERELKAGRTPHPAEVW